MISKGKPALIERVNRCLCIFLSASCRQNARLIDCGGVLVCGCVTTTATLNKGQVESDTAHNRTRDRFKKVKLHIP